jgi:hypothetical protein
MGGRHAGLVSRKAMARGKRCASAACAVVLVRYEWVCGTAARRCSRDERDCGCAPGALACAIAAVPRARQAYDVARWTAYPRHPHAGRTVPELEPMAVLPAHRHSNYVRTSSRWMPNFPSQRGIPSTSVYLVGGDVLPARLLTSPLPATVPTAYPRNSVSTRSRGSRALLQ